MTVCWSGDAAVPPCNSPTERHYVRGLYFLTKTLDSTRPVIGNDGWESVATDIIGIHDYEPDAARLEKRYQTDEVLPMLFRRERPGGRSLVLDGERHADQPLVLSEFGGITLSEDPDTWGYSRAADSDILAGRFAALMKAVHSLGVFAGFCYTQLADTYQEANGLLTADRRPKIPIPEIFVAVTGGATPPDVDALSSSPRQMPPDEDTDLP